MFAMPQPTEGSRGWCDAVIPPVHGPSEYQPTDIPLRSGTK
jgi:hypothetical protein